MMVSRRPCSKCKRLTPLIAFATFRTRKGELRRRGVCRACRDEYAHENFDRLQQWRKNYNVNNRTKRVARLYEMRAKARAYVDTFKTKPCADCTRTFPPVAMDLDHVRGAKSRSVSSLVGGGYRMELIEQELAKCDVVCACCHRIRTAKRKENFGLPGPRKPQADRLATYPEKQPLRCVKQVEFNGETHSISEWARRLGLPMQTLSYRLRRGYPVEAAFAHVAYTYKSSPIRRARRSSETYSKITAQIAKMIRADRARGMTQQRIADKYGLGQSTVSSIVLGRTWS